MVKYWNYEKNKLDPRHVFNKCKTEIYLDCHKCNHTNYIVLNNLRRNTIENLCRFCTKQNGGKRCQEENCIICFNKSFASDWRAEMWNYKLNNNINPKDIPKNDNNFYWFDCNKCNHTFKTTPNYQEAWCPYCGHQKLCYDLYCSFCKPNRFSSIENSKFWYHEKNIDMDPPEYIFKGSAKKGWFNCHKCNHSFEKVINEISRGKFCPYCESKYLCQSVDCQFCFNKSFASHEKSKYILEKDPRKIFKCSGKKYNFKCNTCQNIFNQSIYNITLGNNWCPFCCNKTESLIYDFLVNFFPDIIRQFKIPSAKNILTGRHYKYDFCIPSKLLIIEVDGEQHFKDMNVWYKKSSDQIEIDIIKMKLAIENNYKIIRISQEDVWKNKIDWKNILLNTINNSSDVIYYISLQPDLYKNHIAKIIF
jgi:very-short-patch-repair endonuclease/DNA-directed RNA polymerase subunit RPC12/RpoP